MKFNCSSEYNLLSMFDKQTKPDFLQIWFPLTQVTKLRLSFKRPQNVQMIRQRLEG